MEDPSTKVWALWAWWVRRTKLQNAAGNQEHKVIESCQQESGNVAIEGQKRTSFPERSRTFNRRECSRKPQPSRTLDNALFSNYLNPCLVNPLQWIPGRKARTTSDSLAVSPTTETSKYTFPSAETCRHVSSFNLFHLHKIKKIEVKIQIGIELPGLRKRERRGRLGYRSRLRERRSLDETTQLKKVGGGLFSWSSRIRWRPRRWTANTWVTCTGGTSSHFCSNPEKSRSRLKIFTLNFVNLKSGIR